MKKHIFRSLCLSGIFAVLLSCTLTLWVCYSFTVAQTEENLKSQCRTLSDSYHYIDETNFKHILSALNGQTRATLISSDGTVIFDSDYITLSENHLKRPEVMQAITTGQGNSVRYSSTHKKYYYYSAVLLADGNILRLAVETSGITDIFTRSLPAVAACMILIVIVALLLSSRLTQKLLSPISQMADHIDDPDTIPVYDELAPFALKIRRQNKEIRHQMQKLEYERDTINVITSHMKEGLILVTKERSILSINPSAIRLLTAKNGDFSFSYNGKNILSVNRMPQLDRCVTDALSGKSCDASYQVKGRICRIYASPVYDKGIVSGAILIVLDETQQQLAESIRHEFSANVSHELKTPLTSISGFAEMLENGMAHSPEDVQNFGARIGKESRRLLSLIDDIIHLSRIEEATEKILEPVELYTVSSAALEALLPIAQERNVSLNLSGIHVTIPANPGMIQEMIYNLCENAIKYNKTGGKVDINISRDEENGIITISDTGIGIPEDSQSRIFERFYRVDKSRSKQAGGTGLGLSIVKHIIEYHDGRVNLKSQLGVGTTIDVYLPLQ